MSIRGGRWALVVALGMVGACTLETKTVSGPQGEKGDTGEKGLKGDPGPPGATTVAIDGSAATIQELADLVSAQQQTIATLQAQVESLLSTTMTVSGDAAGPTFSFVIPQSTFGETDKTTLLTVRAAGSNSVLARTFLVHTGQNTGVAIQEIGLPASYAVGAVVVTGNLPSNSYSENDGEKGVTVEFSQMPPTFSYRYTILRVGSL